MFSLKRLYVKIISQEGSPECIARGAALGLVVGFVIPVGLQTFPAIALAFVFKANKVLSWLFTCVTNPATIFAIYPVQCYIGSLLLMRPMSREAFGNSFGRLASAESIAEYWEAFTSLVADIILPFFAGGALFAAVSAPIGYFASLYLVRAYRRRKAEKIRKRLEKMSSAGKK